MRFFWAFILLWVMSSCSEPRDRAEALKVADAFMSAELQGATKMNVQIENRSDGWMITYLPIEKYAGGTCHVFVSIDTMKVVERLCSQ